MKKFLVVSALLVSSCLSAQPKPGTEPIWISIAVLPSVGVSAYYDLTSIKQEKDIVSGILLYIEHRPTEVEVEPGIKKKNASRIVGVITDCKRNTYTVTQSHLFDVEKPKAKDSPFASKIFEPPITKPMEKGSSLFNVFCTKPGTAV